MTVDARGRSAATALRSVAETDIDVRVKLDQLHGSRTHSMRVAVRVAVVAGAVAVTIAAAGLGWTTLNPHASAPPATQVPAGATRQSFDLRVPFTADVPNTWSVSQESKANVNLSSPAGPYVGVGVDPVPAVSAAASDGAVAPGPATLTAQSLAHWVATRTFLQSTTVVSTTVSGLPGWQVDIRLRDDALATQTCNDSPGTCVPLIRLPSIPLPLGVTHGAVARVIFVELPTGRIVGVVASGANASNLTGLLAVTQPVLDSIVIDGTG